jgi:hypothetical protein
MAEPNESYSLLDFGTGGEAENTGLVPMRAEAALLREPVPGRYGPEHDGPEQAAQAEYLRQLLKDQQDATLQAVSSLAELQTQLTAAQTETAKTRTEYQALAKASRSGLASHSAELAALKAVAYRAQVDLQREQQARRMEATKAAAKISQLEGQLHVDNQPPAARQPGWRAKAVWLRVCGALMALAFISVAAVFGHSWGQKELAITAPGNREALLSQQSAGSPASRLPRPPMELHPGSDLSRGSQEEFTQALDRLDYALAAFPGRKAEDVLREVRKHKNTCALTWNKGRPSLLFGGGRITPDTLALTISNCADAVEKLQRTP